MAIMAELQELIANSVKNYREGSIVKGHIIEVRPKEVLVDIGYKSEGVIPANEFDDIKDVKVGDEVDVLLEKLENEEGMVVLSKEKAAAQAELGQDRLASSTTAGSINGKVKAVVKGGLIVNIGVEAFLPGVADRHHPAEEPQRIRRQHLRFQGRQDQRGAQEHRRPRRRELIEQERTETAPEVPRAA